MDNFLNSSKSLKKRSLPFSDTNLQLVNTIANLHSNLFQTIAYFNYNHFEIEVWLEAAAEFEYSSSPEILENLGSETIERIFVQCLALWHMVKAMELDFIDFSRFQLSEPDTDEKSFLAVKFPLRLPLANTAVGSGGEKETGLKFLLACFQKNKYLRDINEKNYTELFNRLKGKYLFSRQQAYIYRYNEFASILLNAYPIDELKNEANIKIKIRTADYVQKKIVKRHLYRNYVAEDIFFVDVDKHWPAGELPQYIGELISGDEPGTTGADPVSIIQRLDLFLRKSAFKSFVLVIDHLKSKEDTEFINYLVHSSGISHIVLIVFTGPAEDGADLPEFDLELNETPGNLLEDYLQFDRSGITTLLNRDEDSELFHSYLENCRVKELNGLLKKYLLLGHENGHDEGKISFAGIKMLLVENLDFLEKKNKDTENVCETRRLLVEILIKEGEPGLAAAVIHEHMEKDPVFLKLKLAQLYRAEKDHPRMHALLEEIKKDIDAPWLDEFNYLNYIYYEKILDVKTADRYLKKIAKPLFIHLANVILSDRYIYEGNFAKAGQLLTEAAVYLEEKKYLEDEIYARSQCAKLLRQKQEFAEAEKLYKNLFIKSEMKHFRLLSAYISVDLGNLYFSRDDFSQADVWYRKALKIFQNLKNKNGIMLAESNLVEVNKIKGNWQETETFLKSILAYDKERKSLDS
ncbi:MAG TPA: hypothetical protein VK469_06670, partial [Candidatus Kapabacteria bacterium]|nr:hypothetical protein [Candidatus Kapabacteria bacterium]